MVCNAEMIIRSIVLISKVLKGYVEDRESVRVVLNKVIVVISSCGENG
jgi:hypothetical protein